ncbi:MAG: putative hydrolase of the HAD superfamily [Alphaproteobacteria bacterium]
MNYTEKKRKGGVLNKFAHIDTYIFDLDDTLYSPKNGFSQQMFQKQRTSLSRLLNLSEIETGDLCKTLALKYKALPFTGLHRDTELDMNAFIEEGFDLDFSQLQSCAETKLTLETLPGRKVVFTNSPACHAEKALKALDYVHVFDNIYNVQQFDFATKPMLEPYHIVLNNLNADPQKCVMIEDSYKNLITAKALGMTTVYVHGTEEVDPDIVDYKYDTLLEFLKDMENV